MSSTKTKIVRDDPFILPFENLEDMVSDVPGISQPQLNIGVNTTKVDVSQSGGSFVNALTFSATDYNTVAWTAGDITTGDGVSTYSIDAGNTGDITATTYIYIDTSVSETALQTTTTAANSVGKNKILVCVASANADTSKDAIFQAFGTSDSSTFITADNIAANTITGNEIVANTITSTQINTSAINLSEWAGDLDDIDDGTYGKVLSTSISAGRITLSETSGDLDDISDGGTYKRTTANEKTGANRGYNALNSSNRYKEWLTNSELSSGSNPTNGVILDTDGLRGYDGGTKTFEIDTGGNAYFKGEIAASSVTGELGLGTSGSLRVGSTNDYINIERIGGLPKIQFNDDFATGIGAEMYYDETLLTSTFSIFNLGSSLDNRLEIGVSGGTTMTFRDTDVRFDGDMNLQDNDMTNVDNLYTRDLHANGSSINVRDEISFLSDISNSSHTGKAAVVTGSYVANGGVYVALTSGGSNTYELGYYDVSVDGVQKEWFTE